jgi:type II secretory pathway component PulK
MTDRRGLALPSAMFALVAIAVLLAGIFVFADLQAKAVRNRERATRAVHVAEAGMNHALGLLRGSLKSQSFTRLLRGWDNAVGTADDSLFIGRGIPISWRSATTRPMATETQRQT